MEKKIRIQELVAQILYHQDLYYNGQPEVSDADFDKMWDELKVLDPDNIIFKKVGEDSLDGFPKAHHVIPMGSQEKAANPLEFLTWVKKISHPEYLVQYKLDGASLELQYVNGKFTRAVTRGNGIIGDDITQNAAKMRGCIDSIDPTFSGGVRCEVIMTHDVHDTYFSDKANCRNAANGLMKRKDGSGSEYLSIICYDVLDSNNTELFHSEKQKMKWLVENKFSVVETKTLKTGEDVVSYRAHVMDIRDTLNYDIDGLVIKGDEIDLDDVRRARPQKQIAFKFSLEEAVSSVLDVEWSESGAIYTPVAIIESVKLAGTTVSRASLANPNIIRNLNLKIGSKVVVTKRGEIIPKIEYLIENPNTSKEILFPIICSTCKTNLIDEGTRLFCPNIDCPKRAYRKIEKWIQVIDAKDCGPAILTKLFESGRIKNISDLYSLTVSELEQFDRMGSTLAKKILDNIYRVKELSLAKFIAGYDIEGIGEKIAERIVQKGYNTLEAILSKSKEELSCIDGIGEITAQALLDGIRINKIDMDKLVNSGKIIIKALKVGGILDGKSFCFTGELTTMKRSAAEALVTELGGKTRSSVSKELTYLVNNDNASTSAKNKKALELGVAIISEEEFLQIVKGTTL